MNGDQLIARGNGRSYGDSSIGISKTIDMKNFNKIISFNNKEGYLIDLMESYQIDLVVLAGFLLMIPIDFIKHFKGKIINIHPSLLPKYGGKGMYGDHVHRAVLKNNESTSGITFHYVNENYDEGEIISQFEVSLSQEETLASLKHKIDVLEKTHYPLVISSISNE